MSGTRLLGAIVEVGSWAVFERSLALRPRLTTGLP